MFQVKTFLRQKYFAVAGGLFLLLAVSIVSAQDNLKKYHAFDFSKRLVTKAELNKLDSFELEMLRGIVFGKRGRVFKEKTIQEYIGKQAWYKPNKNFTNNVLTTTERKNIDLIREAEAGKHDYIQPGDLRFWEKKEIKEDNLAPNTAAEWRVSPAPVLSAAGDRTAGRGRAR